MERQAHFAVVGLVTLILLTAAAAFTFWFIRVDVSRSYSVYDVVFETTVDGLTKGGEVHFNGIKVGEVTRLRLGPDNTRQVIATVRLDAATPVRKDSVATIEPMGITGLFYIQISAGEPGSPRLVPKPNEDPPVIRSTEGRLAKLIAGSGSVIDYTYQGLDRVNRLLSDDNIQTFGRTLDNLESISADINGRKALIDDTHEAVVSLGLAADSITRLADSSNRVMSEDVPQSLTAVNAAAADLGEAAQGIKDLTASAEAPVNTLNTSTLPDIESAAENFNGASQSLRNLVDQVQASPQEFVAKPEARERKVKP